MSDAPVRSGPAVTVAPDAAGRFQVALIAPPPFKHRTTLEDRTGEPLIRLSSNAAVQRAVEVAMRRGLRLSIDFGALADGREARP